MGENQNKLKMTFDPNTIEHLGVRMYSTLPPVIAELIANAYDADASEVRIHLKDIGEKEIVISDNGHGMSFSDINTKFLRIGRNRRAEEEKQLSPGGRKVIGKKGLGKLSFFGIAHEIEIRTVKDGKRNSFKMKWEDIRSSGDRSQQQNYSPEILERDVPCNERDGTKITLREIQRKGDFDAEALSDSLSKFFIVDAKFNIFVKKNDEKEILIDNDRKYLKLEPEIEWNVPGDIAGMGSSYEKRDRVTGYLMATEKPIKPSTNLKGITLFSRKKLVNNPEYFSDSTSSHVFNYLTGWLEVDFIDDIGEDVIGTNRQSLNWEHPDMAKLRKYLQAMMRWLERDWRDKRADKREREFNKEAGIEVREWLNSMPSDIRPTLEPVVESLIRDAEFKDGRTVKKLKDLQGIIKPFPKFHWHNLHPELHETVFPYYKAGHYYSALLEGAKKYHNAVKNKTGSHLVDRQLLENVFSVQAPKVHIARNIKKPDGTDFSTDTMQNIIEGHRLLVIAMWQAFRCPFAHENMDDIEKSGLYSRQDCLDALGLLSHLFRRLDDAEIVLENDKK